MEHSCKHSRTEASNLSFFASDVPATSSDFVWNSNHTLWVTHGTLAEPDQPHCWAKTAWRRFPPFSVVSLFSPYQNQVVQVVTIWECVAFAFSGSPLRDVNEIQEAKQWLRSTATLIKSSVALCSAVQVRPNGDLTAFCLSRRDHAGGGYGGGRGPGLPQLGRHERWALPQEIAFISCTVDSLFWCWCCAAVRQRIGMCECVWVCVYIHSRIMVWKLALRWTGDLSRESPSWDRLAGWMDAVEVRKLFWFVNEYYFQLDYYCQPEISGFRNQL